MNNMSVAGAAAVALALVSMPALAVKPCEELKTEIAAMLEAKQITNYSLDIVPTEQTVAAPAQVVGSCDGGRNKILYTRK
jgi:hypothetical protein